MAKSEIFTAECAGRLDDGTQCPFKFVFERRPERQVEHICPQCGTTKTVKPAQTKEAK